MITLGFDTATPATAVALVRDPASSGVLRRYEAPPPGARPEHASRALALADELLREAGLDWGDIERLAVGVGPGTFTGLRIGVATARALAQSLGVGLAGIGTLQALAVGACASASGPVAAVIDARRGEAFAAAYAGERELVAPAVVSPGDLGSALAPAGDLAGVLAVGDGAIRFRGNLQGAGVVVPADSSPLHRVDAAVICRLASRARTLDPEVVVPSYLRQPDAEVARQRTPQP